MRCHLELNVFVLVFAPPQCPTPRPPQAPRGPLTQLWVRPQPHLPRTQWLWSAGDDTPTSTQHHCCPSSLHSAFPDAVVRLDIAINPTPFLLPLWTDFPGHSAVSWLSQSTSCFLYCLLYFFHNMFLVVFFRGVCLGLGHEFREHDVQFLELIIMQFSFLFFFHLEKKVLNSCRREFFGPFLYKSELLFW